MRRPSSTVCFEASSWVVRVLDLGTLAPAAAFAFWSGLLGALTMLLLGCSDGSESMRIWDGRQVEELTRVWGQPSEVIGDGDAGRTLIYTSYWFSDFGRPHTCQRTFTTDQNGRIMQFSASGCV